MDMTTRRILAIIASVTVGVVIGLLPAIATTLDITTTDFVAGGQIRSGTFLTEASEIEAWANGNVGTNNIPDSGLSYNFYGARSVNSGHIANVGANTLDSGAINSDSMIAFNVISSAKLVSTTDTTDNFSKRTSGFYWGDGSDTRQIWNTYQVGATGTGETIPFTITRVEIHCFTNNDSGSCMTDNTLDDTGVLTLANVTVSGRLLPIAEQGLWGGYANGTGANIPCLGTTGDTNYFTVNYLAGAVANAGTEVNSPGELYYFEVDGY